MLVVIISDIHDNLANLERFLSFVRKKRIKIIISCGDFGGQEALKLLTENFKGKFFSVLGNADVKTALLEAAKNFPRIKIFEDFGEMKLGELRIAFCHLQSLAEKLYSTKKYDFVFYGHTHKPWLKKIGDYVLANPGNLAGVFFKPTFAILDTKTKKISLEILEKI